MKYLGAITDDKDIATKGYVDSHAGGGSKQIWIAYDCSMGVTPAEMDIVTTTEDFGFNEGDILVMLAADDGYVESLNIDGTSIVYDGPSNIVYGNIYTLVCYYNEEIPALAMRHVDEGSNGSIAPLHSFAILQANGWSSNTQTKSNLDGVTSSVAVIVSPAPSSMTAYIDAGVYCSAQGSKTLTFTCATTPSSDITVNYVVIK